MPVVRRDAIPEEMKGGPAFVPTAGDLDCARMEDPRFIVGSHLLKMSMLLPDANQGGVEIGIIDHPKPS